MLRDFNSSLFRIFFAILAMLFINIFAKVNFDQGNACHVLHDVTVTLCKNTYTFNQFQLHNLIQFGHSKFFRVKGKAGHTVR